MSITPNSLEVPSAGSRPAVQASPARSLVLLAIIIFMAEIVSMVVLYFLKLPDYLAETLLDAAIMVGLILPALYFLQLKPLVDQVRERDRAEDALRASARLLRQVLDALPIGVWILDKNGQITHGNPASQEIWAGAHYVGIEQYGEYKGWWPESGKRIEPEQWAAARTISRGETILNEEVNIESFDGARKVILNSAVPILDEQGTFQGAIAVNQDITKRKMAEMQLARQNEELSKMYQAEATARRVAESLSAAARALTQTLDLDQVFNTLIDHLHAIIPSDTLGVILLEDEMHMAVRALRGFGEWGENEGIPTLQFSGTTDSLTRRLVADRRSLILPSLEVPSFSENNAANGRIRNWLVVPVLASERVIGLVEFGRSGDERYEAEQIQWAEVLVAQAGVAIQNAWLFEQVRSSSERLQNLARKLVDIQETERYTIARELHDEAGQALASMKISLRQLEQNPDCPAHMRQGLQQLRDVADGVLEELHRLAMDLRPIALDRLGLVAALEQLAHNMDSQWLSVRFKQVGLHDERLPRDLEIALYRIVQEALTNVVRHAQASSVGILLEQIEDKVKLFIEDDGIGFEIELNNEKDRLGLLGIRERAEMLGGTLAIESSPGKGTGIIVEVPYGYPDPYRG